LLVQSSSRELLKNLKRNCPYNLSDVIAKPCGGVIFQFIKIWYNSQRLHSTPDYRTPTEMQDYLTQQQKLAA